LVPKTFVTYLVFGLLVTGFFAGVAAFFAGGAAFFRATGLAAFLASTFGFAGVLLGPFLPSVFFSSFFFSAGFFPSLASFFATFSSTLRAYFRSLLFLMGDAALAGGADLVGVFSRALVSLAAAALVSALGASFLGAYFLGSSFCLARGVLGAGAGDFEAL
jgi:hypothetical protein